MKFGIFEWVVCGGVLVAIGSYFMGMLDTRDELEDDWQGVVARVHVQDRVEAITNSVPGISSVQEWTERTLYCKRDDGTEEEFELDAEDPACEELLALAPGSRLIKEAGSRLPRHVNPAS